MSRVLFVDDERNILRGLRRMLHGSPWECAFELGGEEALTRMEHESFDIVIADLRMPGMDGIELLEQVRLRFPRTTRIVLSGYADQDVLLRSAQTAHQFLRKPCDTEELCESLSRALLLRDVLVDAKLQEIVANLSSVPSLPSLYDDVLEEASSACGTMDAVGRIIERDVGMSAKILQLVNSAFFGVPCRIESPAQASAMLGLDTLKALILSANIFNRFESEAIDDNAVRALWEHSSMVGVFARAICRYEVVDHSMEDMARVAGLLHECGTVVLASNLPEGFRQARALEAANGSPAWEAERQVFGGDHAAIGAYLLGLWNLPVPIVHAVAHHHDPPRDVQKRFTLLTALHAADVLAVELSPSQDGCTPRGLNMEYIDQAGLTDHVDGWRAACASLVELQKDAA